ncbi:MAG TPA: hypothetical protein VF865_20570 [Acidobacteriaceae bacterium]
MSKLAACVGLASLVALGGCTKIRVKTGSRVLIANLPVASMQASQYNHPGVGPGEKKSLVVTFTQPDGTVLVTEGKGGGKVLWKDVAVTATVVSVNSKGVLSLPSDPRVSDGKTGHVSITVPSHPDLKAELDIPLRYNYAFNVSFSGINGSSGLDGNSGLDGSSGSMGSIDLQHPVAGGNGSDGSNGSDGGNGSNGGDGEDVLVRAALRAGSDPLLEIGVSAVRGGERYYLVDPQGGSLTISSDGGSGGQGGKGGRGGRGGSGGIGFPSGSSGSDGRNGSDGSNGSSGRSGSITVTYDPAVKPYLAAIRTWNPGGPKPILKEEAVAPLW